MANTRKMADRYVVEKRTTGRTNRTTEAQHRRVLYGFCEHAPKEPAKIGRRDVVRWMRTISHVSPTTRRVYFCTVRGFTAWLQQQGHLGRDPFAGMATPRAPEPAHRALDSAQVAALIAACETRREHVLLLLALHTGLRRAELASLEVGDVSLAARTVRVRNGKGGQSRLLPLSDEAARVVGGYLSSEGLSAGPLLRSETHPERGVLPGTVWRIFNLLAKRSGVKVRPGDGVATHATRHTCATDTHRATGDVLVVQQLLGHSNLSTTQRYISTLDVERLRVAVVDRHYLDAA